MEQRTVVDEHTDACNESCEQHTAADDREIIIPQKYDIRVKSILQRRKGVLK